MVIDIDLNSPIHMNTFEAAFYHPYTLRILEWVRQDRF